MKINRATKAIISATAALSLMFGTAHIADAEPVTATQIATRGSSAGSSDLVGRAIGLAITAAIITGVYNFMVDHRIIEPLRTA